MYSKIYQSAKYVKCMVDTALYFVYNFLYLTSSFMDSRRNGLDHRCEGHERSTDYSRTFRRSCRVLCHQRQAGWSPAKVREFGGKEDDTSFLFWALTMSPLSAKLLISLAWMYVRDFQTGADFGRMVDGKGSTFSTASKDGWLTHIANIISEPGVREHCPDQVRAIIEALAAIGLTIQVKE